MQVWLSPAYLPQQGGPPRHLPKMKGHCAGQEAMSLSALTAGMGRTDHQRYWLPWWRQKWSTDGWKSKKEGTKTKDELKNPNFVLKTNWDVPMECRKTKNFLLGSNIKKKKRTRMNKKLRWKRQVYLTLGSGFEQLKVGRTWGGDFIHHQCCGF